MPGFPMRPLPEAAAAFRRRATVRSPWAAEPGARDFGLELNL
jgi:hypothetical protein